MLFGIASYSEKMALITYTNKEQYEVNPLPEINKVTDSNMNEIKQVVNQNAPRVWDNTQNKFPDSGGSGASGSVQQYNHFIGVGVGTWVILTGQPPEQVIDGMEFIAKIDNPGNNPANWRTRG